ncbi:MULTISPECIES: two-component sensor histidine kinase BarA [unclassified Brenneria]|uniref:two-component sensor histidine kinase BarA n=1 Tax=unclassified Brenneria TaxID=2634434 RepID=UPI001553C2B3|nr:MULTISPECIES: two-component sensor histidine kinase BarA [unclassified Brenneria]MBJ7223655.1 two-component sensor histidine kinase BarA [Brenneria sp. L3-3C-1]MEE3644897.1 two-component sensor histidine kinase BarA [Brenneria sp. L3_3C_1]MEE3652353.1 two-component sensor histidine kinase BarA [Brenneria sp. HEZEL_4_2_4]NPD02310.1 two-component sensor histidine kinase BarA [Brenneria sp. hezel4-2-4]
MTKHSLRARMLILILAPTLMIGLLISTFFVIHRYNQLQAQLVDAGTSIIEPLAINSAYAIAKHQQDTIQTLINTLHRQHSNIVRTISVFDNKNQLTVTTNNRQNTLLQHLTREATANNRLSLHHTENSLILYMPILADNELIDDDLTPPLPGAMASVGYLAVELDTNAIKLQQYQEIFIAGLLLLLCMGVSILFAYRLMRDVTAPIRNMVETVDRIRRGQLDSRVEGYMLGELNMLKNGINSMAMSLTAYHEEMQQNIDQATYDLRETLEQMEIQNVELDLAKKRAQEAARIKSEFLANISHELRTPLNGVIGFTRQTLKTSLNPTQTDYLLTIERSANNLLNIINDVLDFSKLEAGKLVLENIPFSLHNTLDEVVMLLAHTAHEKGLELTLDIQHDVPEQFIGDPLRIQQIITNLLGNAIKFTEQGNIDIRVEKRRRENHQVQLEIQIRDTGIGIAERQQSQLFQAFRQADTSISRRHGGTGLGLVITQRLVKEMGGDISFHSQLNKGSTFWLHINLSLNPHAAPANNTDRMQDGKHLAYIESNPAAAQATLDILSQTLFTVSYSPTLEQLPEGSFDILLLGIPVHYRNTLFDYTPRLRDVCRRAPCVILALPSLAQMDAEQLKMFGVHACLSKPISAPRLLPLLQNSSLFPLSFLPENIMALQPPSPAPARLPLRVMAVDDNPANLKLIGTLLEEQVENIILCENGMDAIAQAREHDIDIVLMDIQMPEMDGIRASELIRQLPHHAQTPIIAVTAHSLSNEREQLLQAGMDDYLAKPIDEQMLKKVLFRYSPAKGVIAPPDKRDDSQPSLDWTLAQRQAANKPELARELLQMLLDFLPEVRQQVADLLKGQPNDDIVALIHKLHGSCSYSGVPRLKQICCYLEQQLRQGVDAKALEPEWLELLDEIDNVNEAARSQLTSAPSG